MDTRLIVDDRDSAAAISQARNAITPALRESARATLSAAARAKRRGASSIRRCALGVVDKPLGTHHAYHLPLRHAQRGKHVENLFSRGSTLPVATRIMGTYLVTNRLSLCDLIICAYLRNAPLPVKLFRRDGRNLHARRGFARPQLVPASLKRFFNIPQVIYLPDASPGRKLSISGRLRVFSEAVTLSLPRACA